MPVETCTDCGNLSVKACPWDATTCSECSFMREREAAGITNTIVPCPAHGAFLESED